MVASRSVRQDPTAPSLLIKRLFALSEAGRLAPLLSLLPQIPARALPLTLLTRSYP